MSGDADAFRLSKMERLLSWTQTERNPGKGKILERMHLRFTDLTTFVINEKSEHGIVSIDFFFGHRPLTVQDNLKKKCHHKKQYKKVTIKKSLNIQK